MVCGRRTLGHLAHGTPVSADWRDAGRNWYSRGSRQAAPGAAQRAADGGGSRRRRLGVRLDHRAGGRPPFRCWSLLIVAMRVRTGG